jgi:hypothetical protein
MFLCFLLNFFFFFFLLKVFICGEARRYVKQFKQCGLSCNQIIENQDTSPPAVLSRLPMRDVAVPLWNISLMEQMMTVPTGSDSCSNVSVVYQDSLAWGAYAQQGGVNFTRTWILSDDCGNNATVRHAVFVSSSACPEATPWGSDCSCTSSPPTVNAVSKAVFFFFFFFFFLKKKFFLKVCTGGVWRILGNATFENPVDLKYDRLEVSGTVTFRSQLSIGFRTRVRPVNRAVVATTDVSDNSVEYGSVVAGCAVLLGDLRIELASRPRSRTLLVVNSSCVLDDLFRSIGVDNSSLVGACETYDSAYQVTDSRFGSILTVLSPNYENCPADNTLAMILGITFGCIAVAILAMLLVFLFMRYRQRKMVSELTARSQQLQREYHLSRQLSNERNSLRLHEEMGTGNIELSSGETVPAPIRSASGPISAALLARAGPSGALSPRVIIAEVRAARAARRDADVQARTATLRSQGATLRGQTIEGE